MKKLVLFSLLIIASIQLKAHRDSLWVDGRYYTTDQYKNNEFESWFMPGGGYSIYKPEASDSLGMFSGIAIEFAIYTKVDQNDNPGPSHVRWYTKFNLNSSSKDGVSDLFLYSMGIDLSLEKNPKRNFLIPYFGLEVGGISHKAFGTSINFTPLAGIHLLSTRKLFVNVHGGYLYPVRNFEYLQGWFAYAGINFALWQ